MNKVTLLSIALLLVLSGVSVSAAQQVSPRYSSIPVYAPFDSESASAVYSPCAGSYASTAYVCQTSYSKPLTRTAEKTTASSAYGAKNSYAESPGYTVGAKESARANSNAKTQDTNFDSTNSGYDYRGPMFERRLIYSDSFNSESKDTSLPFYASSKDKVSHNIRNEVVEKYVGASESAYSNSQNRRVQGSEASETGAYDYDGGFSFGKQRMFDSSEYASESYSEPYYYRPAYLDGAYTWRY